MSLRLIDKKFFYLVFLMLLVFIFTEQLQAVPVDSLRVPMQAMKKEVWSYLFPIQVASVVVGAVTALARHSFVPLGIGGGITAAIHFFDGVLGDGSAALI